jgi:putative pyruvate formate lyase activating enzyme
MTPASKINFRSNEDTPLLAAGYLHFQTLFFQKLDARNEWLPDFSRVQPFSNALAKPVWHWKNGFV